MDGPDTTDFRVPKNLSQMMDECHKLNSSKYLKKAQETYAKRNYPDSYKFFVKYLDSLEDPSTSAPEVQEQFKDVVHTIALALDNANESEERIKVYVQALNLFPCDQLILNRLGEHLLKLDLPDIARPYLEKAVAGSKNYLQAENNLMLCKWSQVARWHFRMLNDVQRNSSYCQAIRSAVQQGFTHVIDVGAGCGLLSLVASESPEVDVTAIEENKVLAKMCESVMKENGRENVTVKNIYSTTLTQPLSRCNLLVTEVFDCALFGERMLQTFLHAHETLITEKDYRIIPCGARLYAAAISYKDSQSFRVDSKLPVLGLDKLCIKQNHPEPYEAEDLSLKKFTYVSEPVQVYQINFYDAIYLYNLIHDLDYTETIEIHCLEDALLTSFAVWFELDLNEVVTITTDPRREDRAKCWEQAVYHLPHPIAVKQGQILKFEVFAYEHKLQFVQISPQTICTDCFLVPEEVVAFLNDAGLMAQIIKLAEKFEDPDFLQQFEDPSKPVMDAMPFSVFGMMLAAKMGWKFYTAITFTEIHMMKFFHHVLCLNDIKPLQVGMTNGVRCEPKIPLLNPGTKTKDSKVVLIDPVTNEGVLSYAAVAKGMLDVNQPGCLVLPIKVVMNVVLIYSEWLQTSNVVDDENVFNFKIAQFMNEYSSREHPRLDSSFTYTEYSNAISFIIEDQINVEKTATLQITKTGQINGLYSWFDIQLHDEISYSTKNSSHHRRTCYLLNRRNVQLGESLKLDYLRHGSCMKFSVEDS